MARKSQTRIRSGGDGGSSSAVVQTDASAPSLPPSSGLTALLEAATEQILAVTYWFEPTPQQSNHPVTIRFSGQRVGVKGRVRSGDRFVQDETIERVIPGSGPISLTARIHKINPGEWSVTAHVLGAASTAQGLLAQENATLVVESLHPMLRFWYKWAAPATPSEHVRTCPMPLVRVPGLFPGIWGGMVALGIVLALTLQWLLIAGKHLVLGPWWVVSLGAIVIGIIGAKLWFIVLHRRAHRREGWCIQGFITGAILATALVLLVLHVPAGAFLDVTAPGLLIAMAVGRVGCFFAGCCGGPPTASRFGVWSSDQRVGARRVPTQLLELALALSLGLLTLVAVLIHGTTNGAYFVGGLAAYTLVRQGIRNLRAEQPETKLGRLVTAVLAALVLVVSVVSLVR